VARTTIALAWRRFAYDDPRLPQVLLPADWPVRATRRAFVEVYDGLGPLAEARAREVVAPFGLADDALPRAHTVADLA
jgi:phenylacetic acid degradation operon negative regulatory protein